MKFRRFSIALIAAVIMFVVGGCFKDSISSDEPSDLIFVELTNPAPWAVVSGDVSIKAEAGPPDAVSHVTFFVDGDSLFSDPDPPYSAVWNTAGMTDNHTVFAKAVDKNGSFKLSTMVTVSIRQEAVDPPPSIWITYPPPWTQVSGVIQVRSEAIDNDSVAAVALLIDGAVAESLSTEPFYFTVDTGQLGTGNHTLLARARDNEDNIGYSEMVVMVVQ